VFVCYALGVGSFLIVSSDTAIDLIDTSKIQIVKKGAQFLRSFQNYRKQSTSSATDIALRICLSNYYCRDH
jgi:hypothetical protein